MGPVEPADTSPRVFGVRVAADRKLYDRVGQGAFVVGLAYERFGAGLFQDTPYRAGPGTDCYDRLAEGQVLEELVGHLQLGAFAGRTGEYQCVTAGQVRQGFCMALLPDHANTIPYTGLRRPIA